jgi:AraC-like DNA-binding protein
MMWKVLKDLNLDPQQVIEETFSSGVDLSQRHDPNHRYSYDDAEKLWLRLEAMTGDKCLGIKIASHWHPSYLGALGYAWLASSTLRTAFGRLLRYGRMVSEGITMRLDEDDDGFSVIISYDNPVITRRIAIMAILLDMCRANLGRDLAPLQACFKHSQPDCVADYYAFFRCPLEFDSADNRLRFAKSDIDAPSPGSNPIMTQASDQIVLDYLARMDKADIVSRTKAEITRQLPNGGVTDQSIAAALHMSERSLQRALQDKQLTYKQLLNEVRQDLAKKYLRDRSLSMTEISFLLGFSEMSAFSRAFKRWQGLSPSDYRGSSH